MLTLTTLDFDTLEVDLDRASLVESVLEQMGKKAYELAAFSFTPSKWHTNINCAFFDETIQVFPELYGRYVNISTESGVNGRHPPWADSEGRKLKMSWNCVNSVAQLFYAFLIEFNSGWSDWNSSYANFLASLLLLQHDWFHSSASCAPSGRWAWWLIPWRVKWNSVMIVVFYVWYH